MADGFPMRLSRNNVVAPPLFCQYSESAFYPGGGTVHDPHNLAMAGLDELDRQPLGVLRAFEDFLKPLGFVGPGCEDHDFAGLVDERCGHGDPPALAGAGVLGEIPDD